MHIWVTNEPDFPDFTTNNQTIWKIKRKKCAVFGTKYRSTTQKSVKIRNRHNLDTKWTKNTFKIDRLHTDVQEERA